MHLLVLNKVDYNQYAEGQDLEPEILTVPVLVNPLAIRCMYARKQNRPGSRITFTDGGGFAVTETPEQIVTMMIECGATGRQLIARATEATPAPADATVN